MVETLDNVMDLVAGVQKFNGSTIDGSGNSEAQEESKKETSECEKEGKKHKR